MSDAIEVLREGHTCYWWECDAFVPFDDEAYCDEHTADEAGVLPADCDCYWGWADNMDIEVCFAHREAYE